MEFNHKPVMLDECIDNLNIKENGTYVDCTIGGAGHSLEIYKKLGKGGTLVGIDRDATAVSVSRKRLESVKGQARVILINENYKNILNVCRENGIYSANGIMLDSGVSSYQLDEAGRGFSYRMDAPLDMRMDQTARLDAEHIVNEYDEGQIRKIIHEYGEERWSARIAAFIVKFRKEKRIETTGELVEIIKAAIPSSARREGPHPSKRTFQALRIAVNDELGALEQAVEDAVSMLDTGGRICVITFHSLEDRIVKNIFKKKENPCTCSRKIPVCICGKTPEIRIITKKPILPANQEVNDNPRARSAKLRVAEKI